MKGIAPSFRNLAFLQARHVCLLAKTSQLLTGKKNRNQQKQNSSKQMVDGGLGLVAGGWAGGLWLVADGWSLVAGVAGGWWMVAGGW